jgi:hypothetical protein
MLCLAELNLSQAVPGSVAREALDITHDVLGPEGVGRYDRVKQRPVAAHQARVAAYCLHVTGSESLARRAAAHDSGKPNIAGLSDKEVWTQERRVWVRQVHSLAGAAWLLNQGDRLPDYLDLAWTAQNHHKPPKGDNNLIVVEAFDRTDALTSRPYVREREGELSPAAVADLVFAADLATGIHALPDLAEVNGQVIDLRSAVGEIAAGTQRRERSLLTSLA